MAILHKAGLETSALSTVIVVENYDTTTERLLFRSDAALFVIASAGGIHRLATAFRIVPRPLRNAVYDLVARWRYRFFGQKDACPIPSAATRAKFLDFKAHAAAR